MANFLQMRYTTENNGFDDLRQGFTIASDPPDSGTVDYRRVWVRNRLSFTPNFRTGQQWVAITPSGSIPIAYLNEVHMGPLSAYMGIETGSEGKPFVYFVSFFSSPWDADNYSAKPTGSYYGNNEPGVTQHFSYIPRDLIFTGRPIDIVYQLGEFSGAGYGGSAWIGPAGGPYTLMVSGTVINTTYTGSLFKYYTNLIFPNVVAQAGFDQTVRLFQWEVVDALTHTDPFKVLINSASFTGSLTGVQIHGDDFSTYTDKEDFQLSVNNSTTSNAALDDIYYNPNYYSYSWGIGFYDTAFDYFGPSGSTFEFRSTPRLLPWSFLSSSTNSPSTTDPFGGTAVWQLCNAYGDPVPAATLVGLISSSWNSGSISGSPMLGMFEYTPSPDTETWVPDPCGSLFRIWDTYPGVSTTVSAISMSLRSVVDASFYVTLPSGAYGATIEYNNYGFYPISPINASSSIFDVV